MRDRRAAARSGESGRIDVSMSARRSMRSGACRERFAARQIGNVAVCKIRQACDLIAPQIRVTKQSRQQDQLRPMFARDTGRMPGPFIGMLRFIFHGFFPMVFLNRVHFESRSL